MTRRERLARNPRLLFWAKVLCETKSLNAFITIFYLARGVSLSQTVYLSAVYAAVSVLLEVPSGYLADRIGRRKTMLLGVLCLMAAQVVYLVAHGFPAFVVAFIFLAAGGACFSGTEEALLFDSLKEIGEEQTMTRHNSRYLSARNLPKIFIPALGAFVAHGLLEWQLQALIGFDLITAFFAGIVLMRVVEPEHAMSVAAVERGIYRESLSTLREHRWLLAATINKVIPMTVGLMIWRVYQPYLLDHGATIIGLGVLYIGMHSAMFSLRWLTEYLETRFGVSRMLNLTVFLMVVCQIVAVFLSSPWLLGLMFAGVFVIQSVREPLYSYWVNQHITSRSRATTLSHLNLLKSLSDIPVLMIAGWMAAIDPRYVFVFGALLCLSVLVFFRVKPQDRGVL